MQLPLAISFAVLAGTSGCVGLIDGSEQTGSDGGGKGDGPTTERVVDIIGPDVLPHVQKFANTVCGATGACYIATRTGHHPSAERALDILVSSAFGKTPTDNWALGDKVAAFALSHQAEHGIWYVIWRQRYNDGSGWDPMEDRGSITQNHYDHVHMSFEETGP